jgi:hypothetical protein
MKSIPPLAGLCTYEEAARIGYSVEDSVRALVRYAWVEKRAMDMGLYWLNPTPEWEVKEALSLHLYQDSEHVSWIRRRVTEMRNPPPRMDVSPTDSLHAFTEEVLRSEDTVEKLVGLYGVLKPALLAAYRRHHELLNPLVDHPTRRLLRALITEEEEAVRWGEAAIAAVTSAPEAAARAAAWRAHLEAYLGAAGGIGGDAPVADEPVPAPRADGDYTPDFVPRRDDRFELRDNFLFPPHEVARTEGIPADERTLALMCKRTLEMDVPEVMARMIAEAEEQPWEYYTDMCRQLWDEARHAMMGSVYMERRGIDWRREIALHPGFAIRLNLHMSPLEAHAVLYTIEQSLMPAATGKRYEWETAGESGDELAKLFQDYDWADEVLHAQIGRRWLTKSLELSRDDVIRMGQQKAVESEQVLTAYAEPERQVNWWPGFVRRVLGRETAMDPARASTSDPVYRDLQDRAT